VGSRWAWGDPDETYGPVALADVVRAIRGLEPGFHTVAEVQRRYAELTGAPGDHLPKVAAVVTRFGLRPYSRNYERGWTINPAELAQRWPRLPWTD
jgi:hypothetical protein